ncbi:hypothetical protein BJY04DRAFT_226143 [Aspergillus karnatakaensis]|uniref:NAD(P)/FAD-dependent oxidoreductase n=1 Tax=Aspergillus karnatakaensis TaxID=1810916 RepID=UPI003CCD65D0
MSIPEDCTVLVIGGGPGGSYAASVLARENIDTVLLEAEYFPRYHIGESLLPSTREFLKFIDLYDRFESHGFKHKNGASFTYNSKPAAYTNFLPFGGHAWNVIRSEADHIFFQHAGESGARTFQGVKVESLEFNTENGYTKSGLGQGLGRPVSAKWTRKDDGLAGTIRFKYLVDASGRAGIVSTKYLKNRRFNEGLKNIAVWGYFEGAATYGAGTPAEGGPFFPRLEDGSGWAWFIPLHNNTTSVGLVMNQTSYALKKKQMPPRSSSKDFFLAHLNSAPGLADLLTSATLTTTPSTTTAESSKDGDIKSTTDWSYSATAYSLPYTRIVGDAGCFIDPLFSSGVHIALTGALTAAASICGSIRGHCSEPQAASFHSTEIREVYTRFLLVVTSAYAQIRGREGDVLNEYKERDFGRAFGFLRPIIQGAVELNQEKLTAEEVNESVSFCLKVIEKVDPSIASAEGKTLCEDEFGQLACDRIKKAEMKAGIQKFEKEVINGMTMNLERGRLGLKTILENGTC